MNKSGEKRHTRPPEVVDVAFQKIVNRIEYETEL